MPAVATAALVGAAVGAGVAIVTGGNVGKGALFGAIGGGITGAFGAGANAVTSTTAGEVAGSTAATAGSVGAETAATTTGTMAESLVDASASAANTATPAVGSEVASGAVAETHALNLPGDTASAVSDAVTGTPSSVGPEAFDYSFDGTGIEPGASTIENAATSQGYIKAGMNGDSLWGKVSQWAKDNPKLAAGVLQGGGTMVAGLGKGVGDYMTAERKAELELENRQKLTEYYRRFVQGNTSIGGGGVDLGFSSPGRPQALTRPDGSRVYGSGGLINRARA